MSDELNNFSIEHKLFILIKNLYIKYLSSESKCKFILMLETHTVKKDLVINFFFFFTKFKIF